MKRYLDRRLISLVESCGLSFQKSQLVRVSSSFLGYDQQSIKNSSPPSIFNESIRLSYCGGHLRSDLGNDRRLSLPRFARVLSSASDAVHPAICSTAKSDVQQNLVQVILKRLKESPVEEVARFFFDHCKKQEHDRDSTDPNFELTAILDNLRDNPQASELFLKTCLELASNDDAQRGTDIGGKNEECHPRQNNCMLRPGRDHFDVVLNSWRRFQPPSAKRIQGLLEYMEKEAKIDYDTESCNLVLETWAKKGNAERTQAFFDYVMMRKRIPADLESFSHVLKSWSRSKSAVATIRADEMLDRMESYHYYLKPSAECYLHVIECWSKSKRKGSEIRIESLVNALKHRLVADRNQNDDRIDDVDGKILQTAVWNLLKVYDKIENAHRAEEILFEFVDDFDGNKGINYPPITIEMCLSVLSTWSKSASSNRAVRAEKLLRLMDENPSLPKPDTASYTAVLNCIASSKKQDAAKRAEALLRRMDRKKETEANMVSLTCVLIAWARSEDLDATTKAERIFQEMLDRGMRPDRFVFAGLITAWGRSNKIDSLVKVEEYFQRIRDSKTINPTVVEYTAVIQAYANYVSRNVDKSRESVDRVEDLLDEMLSSGDRSLRPNILSYAAVLKTIAAARRIPNRRDHAQAVLQKMHSNQVEITPYIMNLVKRCQNRKSTSKTGSFD
mmetsp:Transcript_10290/g.30130  ORF Transcript_10290/g.30130 Transcript_10290/m.30130 type:complete len:675 (-) Transcript_10290:1737-3761(-)|eukprot:CAMPEP_0172377810 /NCGR_PEP_ID=MMETSP1060-20121228/69103_1 /TAXON_ID=37318 /ORGANISM="Pseudo-nitzschia pungens, Strain cf. cingulata" /LENGTH=674 /DNA_ID=CAMNT_0013105519 /DNA_START=154 /DNA_END=2178 /DNA_ORIENTATION=-